METEKIISDKKRLMENLERLPESDIQEVLDFVEFILIKRYKKKKILPQKRLDLKKDPILKLMGIADVEPFSNKIDQELYGQ
jgi:hypothetical protein